MCVSKDWSYDRVGSSAVALVGFRAGELNVTTIPLASILSVADGIKSASVPVSPLVIPEDEQKNQLAKEFARSFSLREQEEQDDGDIGYGAARGGASGSSLVSSYKLPPAPTLSFGNDFETPAWGSSVPTPSISPSTAYRSPPLQPPSATSYTSPPLGAGTRNPFAMSSSPSLSFNNNSNYDSYRYGYPNMGMGMDSAGLLFGSADGTITSASGGANGSGGVDAWAVPGGAGRKPGSSSSAGVSSGFGANPWA